MQPWTEDEDFYLSQWHAMYGGSDPKRFEKILETFTFREGRTAEDLADRWRELTEQVEPEDLEKLKSPEVKPHRQTWTYRFEPQVELPDVEKMVKEYRDLPSLSMKTQSAEVRSSKFEHDDQNINEMCLNNHFDAKGVKNIVQNVLQRSVDDDILRETLLTEFMDGLAAKGREFAVQDFTRKLRIINEMDQAQAEHEAKILIDQLREIIGVVWDKAKFAKQPISGDHGNSITGPLVAMMTQLQGIVWPVKRSAAVERIWCSFRGWYFKAAAGLLMASLSHLPYPIEGMWKPFVESLIRMDVNQEIEQNLPDSHLRRVYIEYRQQLHQ